MNIEVSKITFNTLVMRKGVPPSINPLSLKCLNSSSYYCEFWLTRTQSSEGNDNIPCSVYKTYHSKIFGNKVLIYCIMQRKKIRLRTGNASLLIISTSKFIVIRPSYHTERSFYKDLLKI